jgi:Wadjet anti plasmid transformation system JetA-like protein
MNPEPVLTQAIWNAIETHPTSKVPLQVLQRAAAAVDNTGAASVGWRARVLTAIEHLAADGQVTLPKTRIDSAGNPPLPLYVTRPTAPRAPRSRTPPPVWHADLAWAAALFDQGQLTRADQRFLTAINSWLSKRRGVPVPLRERSLEIFGDEKLLETRITGPLFAPGRLTLDLLQTYLCWPPVERLDCGPGDWLIVENYTTYHSLAQRARQLGFDGQIIWGSGNGVTTRLAALAAEPARPPRLYYFGDIDAGGFRIARSAAARAETLNMPKLTAAQGLYSLTHTHGAPRADTNSRNPDQTVLAWAREWLAEPLASAVAELLATRQRIVQETVGTELLATTAVADWF